MTRSPDSVTAAINREISPMLDVRVDFPIDLLGPTARYAVILPSLRDNRRLLQDEQIIAASARALAIADAQIAQAMRSTGLRTSAMLRWWLRIDKRCRPNASSIRSVSAPARFCDSIRQCKLQTWSAI
jgi:hypothetical protein